MTVAEATLEASDRRVQHRWLWGIVLVGIGLRVLAVLRVGGVLNFPDSADYDVLARCLAFGQEYVANGLVASRMPGYPAFVSNFYLLFGAKLMPVLLGQAVLSGVTGLLVYALGREFSKRAGRVAAGMFAIDPLTIGFTATLLTETLFTTLLLLMMWMALRAARKHRMEDWLGMGLIGTVATYVRAEAVWLIVPLGLAVMVESWRGGGGKNGRGGRMGVAVLGMASAMIIQVALVHPWQARNAGLFPESPPHLTTLEGISLYESVYPGATGGPMQDKIREPVEMVGMSEGQRDARWKEMAWADMRKDPLRMVRLAVVKVGRTWSPWMNAAEMRRMRVQVGLTVWHVSLFGLAVLGVWRGWRGVMRGWVIILMVPVVYFTAIHAVYLGSVRYRVPVMGVVHVFAAVGLSWGWSLWRERVRGADRLT